jgi:hypothetical protein
MKITNLGSLLGFVLISIVWMSEARASTQQLFTVSSDFKSGAVHVALNVDDATGEIAGLYVDNDYYTANEIRSGSDLKLDGVDNSHKPLRIVAAGVSTTTGGRLVLNYLHNGITGSRPNYAMDLRREGNQWRVFPPGDSRPIASLYLTKNTTFGQVIGIDTIRTTLGAPVTAIAMN